MNDRSYRMRRLQTLLIAANGEVESVAKLHSLVFLCEYAGTDLGQDFEFQYYRLYSPTLARDIELAAESQLLNRTGESGKVRLLSEHTLKSSLNGESGFLLVEKLRSEKSEVLEVLAVLCYLHKVGYSTEQLLSKLEDLKPELKDYFKTACELAARHLSIETRVLARA